jgi:hypothetical protein
MKKHLLCILNIHKWNSTYDPMYDKYSRVCERCEKKQKAKSVFTHISYEDEPKDKK